jgi:diguanylate cyclase (GGDEF)-like protein/PAS domain S-box-containing protein
MTPNPTPLGGSAKVVADPMNPMLTHLDLDDLDSILAHKAIRSVYQPIVSLDSGATLAFEALARGPRGSALERPDLLFATGRRTRRLADLDRACRTAAILGAKSAGLRDPWTLFVNIEPQTAYDTFRPVPEPSASGPEDGGLRIVVELTERALTAHPTQLLQLVARVRARGWGIALDDVGADRNSLALLPLLRPDVIKLDLRLIQDRPSADVAEIVSAVNAEAERSGTAVLAEGIETEEHLAVALGLGATLGQGWLLGRPGPLPETLPSFSGDAIRITQRGDQVSTDSPFVLGSAMSTPRAARKTLLIEVSKHLERQALRSGESAVVLSAFQDVSFFTPATRRRYTDLAKSAAFVGALGEGMPADPIPGVRGGIIAASDPLIGEWDIAVVGPHFAATLVARDLGDDGPDAERRFEFVLSHDRELAIAVATSLMSRIWPEPRLPDLPVPDTALSKLPLSVIATALATTPRDDSSLVSAAPGLLDRALNATRTGIAIADATTPDMPLIYVNPGFETITGYPAEQVLGRNCRFLQGPGTDPRSIAEMSEALRGEQTLSTRLLNYRQDGTPFWNQLELHPVFDEAGTLTHYISVQDDVSARVEAEAKVTFLAYHDQLTGLPNRALLFDEMERALHRGQRHGTATALLFIDLNNFKAVNDQHGHVVGDNVLRRVAAQLRTATRDTDVLARQGGDEFLLLLTDLDPRDASTVANRVAEQVHTALRQPIGLTDVSPDIDALTLNGSIGISLAPADASTAHELIRLADAAMYRAKRHGKHQQ